MLNMILETISASVLLQLSSKEAPRHPSSYPQVRSLLDVLKRAGNKSMSRDKLQRALNLNDRKYFCKCYLKPALEAGLIEMTIPEKPNSPLQCYWLKNIMK